MKNTFLAIALLCFTGAIGLMMTTAPKASASTFSVQTYSFTDSAGSTVNASLDPATGSLIVGFLSSGNGTAYEGVVPSPGATFYATKTEVYGSSTMPESLRMAVTQGTGTLTIALKGVTYVLDLESDSLPAGYHCRTPSGTGACDNVHTNSDWWRCYWCCYWLGCPI